MRKSAITTWYIILLWSEIPSFKSRIRRSYTFDFLMQYSQLDILQTCHWFIQHVWYKCHCQFLPGGITTVCHWVCTTVRTIKYCVRTNGISCVLQELRDLGVHLFPAFWKPRRYTLQSKYIRCQTLSSNSIRLTVRTSILQRGLASGGVVGSTNA